MTANFGVPAIYVLPPVTLGATTMPMAPTPQTSLDLQWQGMFTSGSLQMNFQGIPAGSPPSSPNTMNLMLLMLLRQCLENASTAPPQTPIPQPAPQAPDYQPAYPAPAKPPVKYEKPKPKPDPGYASPTPYYPEPEAPYYPEPEKPDYPKTEKPDYPKPKKPDYKKGLGALIGIGLLAKAKPKEKIVEIEKEDPLADYDKVIIVNGKKTVKHMSNEERMRRGLPTVGMPGGGSPVAFDLNGDGKINTIAKNAGVQFDLDGNGRKENIAWIDKQDGFLMLDRNGNGSVDSGKELFGDQHGAYSGFEELAKFDGNNDGRIDAEDEVYQSLKVWQDTNANGQSDAGELKTLGEHGIESISVSYSEAEQFVDSNNVDHRQHGTIETTQGNRKAVDIWFEMPD